MTVWCEILVRVNLLFDVSCVNLTQSSNPSAPQRNINYAPTVGQLQDRGAATLVHLCVMLAH
ncbi:hypothetical protein BDR04DRAFT_1088916 [Suillus decipiens]|nr:hypothetical protein BDR04DRAFT_1088916 [Suillus decipiens]